MYMTEKIIKNVLSVDIDYIMGPCIQLYNDMCGQVDPKLSSEEFWCKVQKERYLNNFLSFDKESLDFVLDLMFKVCEEIPSENIYIGEEHDSILTFLCADEKKKDEIFNVYNIDHHHDIYYGNPQKEEVERFNYASISNWVWYLFINKKLNDYYWINNESSDSESIDPVATLHLNFDEMNYFVHRKDKLFTDVKFDYLFFCKSERFFPLKFHNIFYDIVNDISKRKNTTLIIDNKSYCGGKSRNPV